MPFMQVEKNFFVLSPERLAEMEEDKQKEKYIELLQQENELQKETNSLLTSELAKVKIDLMLLKGGA